MNIYGVKFNDRGKIYYFNAHDLKIDNDIHVIVETEKGLQYGLVVEKVNAKKISSLDNYKDIVRVATKEDDSKHFANLRDANQALKKAQELANALHLEMRFLSSSYTFDKKQ